MKIIERKTLPKKSISVHASTVCIKDNHPVFAWFEGSREGSPDVFIRIFNLNGEEDSILIGDKDGVPRWNPILFTHGDQVFLFTKAGVFCDRWQTNFYNITNWNSQTSAKEISNFTLFSFLPCGLNGCVKTKPIFVDGKMYCGSSVETFSDWTSYIECYEIENSKLKYNFRSNPLAVKEKQRFNHPYNGATSYSQGIIQPSLWIDNDKVMHAMMRSSFGLGKIYYSKSKHPYSEWEEPIPLAIPNPNSSVDTVYVNGRLFLVCNPTDSGRLPLSLVELDKDFNPIEKLDITTETNGVVISNEASYPYLIEHNGILHLTYTHGRSYIEYVMIEI